MKRFVISMLILLACVGLVGCGEDSQTWRQKLRVVVTTPNGDVAGEAISEGFIKVLGGTETLGRGAGVGGGITHGEATVVDLGQGRYLFALLDGNGDNTWYLPFYTFLEGFPSTKWPTYVDAAHEFVQVKGARDVPQKQYPLLVTFTNIADPKSVKAVRPNDLASAFGDGYSLKSITLEITDAKLTTDKVAQVVPWTQTLMGSIGRDMKLPYLNLLNRINDGSFKQGK
jgi:hypothetical protein